MTERESGTDSRWHRIPVALPQQGQTVAFEIEGRALLLCNAAGEPYVVKDECPHVRVSMVGGQVRGNLLECPLHGGLIDLRDGSPAGLPIRRPVPCHRVRKQGEALEVEIVEESR